MISLVAVVNTDVTAHGFEHHLLGYEVELCPRFGYECQLDWLHMAQYVVPFVDDALGIS